jgi:hypothetical protein
MKNLFIAALIGLLAVSCISRNNPGIAKPSLPITGTWKLITGTVIDNGDTTVTNYLKDLSFIKIINDSHFSFLEHDLKKGNDDAAIFVAGGGRYTLNDNQYTEHLEYCSDRVWEGNDFTFTATIRNDTLTLRGIEKVETAAVDQLNTEVYVRLK